MQNWLILAKFKSSEIGCFLQIVSWRSFPPKFPVNRLIFLRICPWKSFEIWLFSAKILWNRPIFLRILTFLPRNRSIFQRIMTFFPRKSCQIGRCFCEFAPDNPAKFCFFSAKYQKPWLMKGWFYGCIPLHFKTKMFFFLN